MNTWNTLKSSICRPSVLFNHFVRNKAWGYRKPSPCDVGMIHPDAKPCFDINNVVIERGNVCHAKMIRSFLYTHFWPREPSVTGVWMPMTSPYLKILTEKYANSGDRLLAFEKLKRTGEHKLVGVAVGNTVYPWVADELEEWAHYTCELPEKHRMYFCAHCLRAPNLFKKFKTDYVYEVEVIATATEVTGQGVGALLLRRAIVDAMDLGHPLVQVIAVSNYTAKICEKCGMQRAWSMDYSEFVDDLGRRVFYPRRPHRTAAVYIKPYTQEPFSTCP